MGLTSALALVSLAWDTLCFLAQSALTAGPQATGGGDHVCFLLYLQGLAHYGSRCLINIC